MPTDLDDVERFIKRIGVGFISNTQRLITRRAKTRLPQGDAITSFINVTKRGVFPHFSTLGRIFLLFTNSFSTREHPANELEMDDMEQSRLRSLYGRNPTLDPNSAHRRIILSEDLSMATRTEVKQPYSEHADRFDFWDQVLATDSYSSGCHYWEIDVSQSRYCAVGVALNNLRRKGGNKQTRLGWNSESWCICKWFNDYIVMHNNVKTQLSLDVGPLKFGLFLDCEKGELTVFGDSQVLHVFKGNFSDSVKPALLFGLSGSAQFCSL
uniref:tripartite motif-containing protein 14-like n=1 Tax=Myxine glutinosa TaxID=7769 RepID=UPI00358EBBE2